MMFPLISSKSSSKSSSGRIDFISGSGSALCSVIFATSLSMSGLVSIFGTGFEIDS